MEKHLRRYGSMDYTPRQIRHTIERYQELRSIAEVVASSLEDGRTNVVIKCRVFENIVCMLVDLDNSILTLTPRQQEVVALVKMGYSNEIISKKLNISVATTKFHINAAILRINTYLNFGKITDKDERIS
jgi:DNA-binding NarL/FixJ family response regulator